MLKGDHLMLIVEKLSKRFDKLVAVSDVSFTVKPNEIYGFLGHNGAGKTTTLKMCTGLLSPDQGRVKICDYDVVSDALKAKASFGYVGDSPYLFKHLTGREYLELLIEVYKLKDKALAIERMNELLDEFDMTQDADRLMGTYSLGMKRKISLCGAFLHQPSVVFLDEPTNGLDAASAKVAKDLIRRHANQGCAIVLTTHVLEIAERMCDRIGIISNGKIIAEGTFEELKEAYSSADSTLEDIFLNLVNNDEKK